MAQHLSLRVPWHDSFWNGNICRKPKENQACLRLKNIYQNKNDTLEEEYSGCEICDIECRDGLPCVREGGCFMSPKEISIVVDHPYRLYGYETHKHLLPTEEIIPPYAYPARPYRWTMKNRWIGGGQYFKIEKLAEEQGIDYHPEYEPAMNNTTWVQDGRNQKAIFDSFYQEVIPGESLCIFYAKQVPFVEDARRIVVGIGHVTNVKSSAEYNSTDPNAMKSYTWETMISHSIRPNMEDGFLLPYQQLMEYAEEHENFDISKSTVFASDDYFDEFSYASEQVSYDAIIDVILQCLKAIELIKSCGIEGNWDRCITWLNQQLISVWEDRGPFPGLGALLVAFGIPSGVVVARELKNKCDKTENLWDLLDRAIKNPENYLSSFCSEQINFTIQSTWKKLTKERRNLFQVLSRINLSIAQADALYNTELRNDYGILITDEEIIKNPYLLYEKTRNKIADLRVSIKKVDLAFFPPEYIKNQYPISEPTKLKSSNDERRVRAIAISILETSALEGNTILPASNLVLEFKELPIEPMCQVNGDIIFGMEDYFADEIITDEDQFGKSYFKLVRYRKIDKIIKNQVSKRVKSPNRHVINVDWRKCIDEEFKEINPNDRFEAFAREEKTAVLKMLAESRLSVLVGGAGTGKTSVLSILCQEEKIQAGGILLLAPTGKARVRMSQGMKGKVTFKANTVAQFLIKSGRYDGDTFTYKILEGADRAKGMKISIPETVIIDEASMLTEEMFGALLDAISDAGRIIFVGDTNQLPPIGAGRPFVDLVRYLKSVDEMSSFPNVGKCYGKLMVTRRQLPGENLKNQRVDVRLAKWFTEGMEDLDENIFSDVQCGVEDGTVIFKQWKDKDDLEEKLLQTIAEITEMSNVDDIDGFNRSLGANIVKSEKNSAAYFNKTQNGEIGCAKAAEDWQILSPVKNNTHGVLNINHMIHEKYRTDFLELANRDRYRKIPRRMGPESIVYGDKVINVINLRRKGFPDDGDNFVANGEIGMACGNFGNSKTLKYLNVEFSSQIGYSYSYEEKDFGEEGIAPLELAYALTVHKSQGSQFGTVILVLSDKCFLLSKELLYTALTRQKDKIIILYNEEAYNLRKYSSMEYSDIAKRFTDLFAPPKIVEVNNKYYEENLIHRTASGLMVRSKSEVIIANMLDSNGIKYLYEEKLPLGDTYKLPDFTIKDAAAGTLIIWEHCGMMTNPEYKERWEAKKRVYEANGYSEKNGNLIVTEDDEFGGVDSQVIQSKIDEYLL